MAVHTCGTPTVLAAPQQAQCDTIDGAAPGAACDCGNASCNGGCRGGLFGKRGHRRQGCNDVRCPDCENCFPEEYCKLTVEKGEEEYTCYEIDYKTICIPKVTFPWQKKNRRGCQGNGTCDGSCGGSCDGIPTSSCGNGSCDGTCGGGCDGMGGNAGCRGAGCTRCGGAGCGGRRGAGCGGLGCRLCKDKAEGCCPPAEICIPCNPCAEARSVKILKKKKYKCPKCKCKWEVVKPELPAAPAATPAAQPTEAPQQPTPAAQNYYPTQPQPSPQQPVASPTLNDYYGQQMTPLQQVPQQMAAPLAVPRVALQSGLQPEMGSGPAFSFYDAPKQQGQGWTLKDLIQRRKQAAQQQQGPYR